MRHSTFTLNAYVYFPKRFWVKPNYLCAQMITVGNLSVLFGGKPLFEDISFMIQSRDKVGLTGKNGAGKSTLLKIISKQQEPTKGNVAVPSGYRIGYLPQEMKHATGKSIFEEARTAFDEVLGLEKELNDISHQLETRTDYESDEYHELIERLNDAGQRLSLLGGGSIDGETEKILIGLGFKLCSARQCQRCTYRSCRDHHV